MKRTTSVLGLALAAALLLPACTGGTGTGVSAGTELPSVDADGNQIINVAYELPLSGGAGGWDGCVDERRYPRSAWTGSGTIWPQSAWLSIPSSTTMSPPATPPRSTWLRTSKCTAVR